MGSINNFNNKNDNENFLSKYEPMKFPPNIQQGYLINRKGEVISPLGLYMNGTKDSRGYKTYNIKTNEGKKTTIQAHVAVAKQFLPNPNNLPFINHKDENKQNPCITNLEWCNQEYNCNYGKRNKKISDNKQIPINEYDLSGNYIRTWKSADAFGKFCNDYNLSDKKYKSLARNITACCSKNNKSHAYGKMWRYYEGNFDKIECSNWNNLTHKEIISGDMQIPDQYLYSPLDINESIKYFQNHECLTKHDIMLFNEMIISLYRKFIPDWDINKIV